MGGGLRRLWCCRQRNSDDHRLGRRGSEHHEHQEQDTQTRLDRDDLWLKVLDQQEEGRRVLWGDEGQDQPGQRHIHQGHDPEDRGGARTGLRRRERQRIEQGGLHCQVDRATANQEVIHLRIDGLPASLPTTPSNLGGKAQPPNTSQTVPSKASSSDSFETAQASSLFGSSRADGAADPNQLQGRKAEQIAEQEAQRRDAQSEAARETGAERDAQVGAFAEEAIQAFGLAAFVIGAVPFSPLAGLLGGVSNLGPRFNRELGGFLRALGADDLFTIPGRAASAAFSTAQDLLNGDVSTVGEAAKQVAEVPVAVAEGTRRGRSRCRERRGRRGH